jgi:hypothetical protein
VQHFSPNQPFKLTDHNRSQTGLSLRPVPTNEARNLLL